MGWNRHKKIEPAFMNLRNDPLDFWGLPYIPLAMRVLAEPFDYSRRVGVVAWRRDGAKASARRLNRSSRVLARAEDYEIAKILSEMMRQPPYLARATPARYGGAGQ